MGRNCSRDSHTNNVVNPGCVLAANKVACHCQHKCQADIYRVCVVANSLRVPAGEREMDQKN